MLGKVFPEDVYPGEVYPGEVYPGEVYLREIIRVEIFLVRKLVEEVEEKVLGEGNFSTE